MENQTHFLSLIDLFPMRCLWVVKIMTCLAKTSCSKVFNAKATCSLLREVGEGASVLQILPITHIPLFVEEHNPRVRRIINRSILISWKYPCLISMVLFIYFAKVEIMDMSYGIDLINKYVRHYLHRGIYVYILGAWC